MYILKTPELLGSYIALCTLFFAVFQLYLKIYNTTIEKVGKLYSKIISSCQQLEGQVLSVKKLSENIVAFSKSEVIGYANSYLRNENLASTMDEIMDLTLPCFNLKKKAQEIESVKAVYNFTSLAISLEASITAFYQGILAGSKYQVFEIEKIHNRMNKCFKRMIQNNKAQEVVFIRLAELRKRIYPHYSPQILISGFILIFAIIEFLLRIGCL